MKSNIDYTIFYKKSLNLEDLALQDKYDYFISSFNESERVNKVFEQINATNKLWIILPEYKYDEDEIPKGDNVFYNNTLLTESEYLLEFIEKYQLENIFRSKKVCIDITGMSRPHLIFFFRYCYEIGVHEITTIYTDPISYKKNENTTFTAGYIDELRQITLCEGVHNPDTSNDYLVIGSGYDHTLISFVANNKDKAKKIQVFGFPPLKPHMYQENILQVLNAKESIGGHNFINDHNTLFAPANDPFVTAQVLHEFVTKEQVRKKITNLYLSPLSTKAQTLGFVLFYIWECLEEPVSIIFPFSSEYSRETTIGVSKISEYKIVLPVKVVHSQVND